MQLQDGRSPDPVPFQRDDLDAATDLTAFASAGTARDPALAGGGAGEDDPLATLLDRYRSLSASARVASWLGSLGDDEPGSPFDVQADVAEEAVSVYRRGRAVIEDLAATYGVDTLLTWQPHREPPPGYLEAARDLAPGTVDVSCALDDVDPDLTYLDRFHTNEEGARVVARTLWPLIEPAVTGRIDDRAAAGRHGPCPAGA